MSSHLISFGGKGSVESLFKGIVKNGFAGGVRLLGYAVNLDSVANLVSFFLEAIGLLLDLRRIVSGKGHSDGRDGSKGGAAAAGAQGLSEQGRKVAVGIAEIHMSGNVDAGRAAAAEATVSKVDVAVHSHVSERLVGRWLRDESPQQQRPRSGRPEQRRRMTRRRHQSWAARKQSCMITSIAMFLIMAV